MYHFAYRVFWHEPDESYVAVVDGVPELEFLSAFGDSPEAALAERRSLLEAVEESYRKAGEPMPAPTPTGT